MTGSSRRGLRRVLAGASLRMRVLAATGVLVTAALAVMGLVSTALLDRYLLDRTDTQLRAFARAVGTARDGVPRTFPPAAGDRTPPQLPSSFRLEIVDADGTIIDTVRPSLRGSDVASPDLTAGRLSRAATGPFTVPARPEPGLLWRGHLWRVLVQPLADGRSLVLAVSLDDAVNTVDQLALIDTLVGVTALGLLGAGGLLLIRASLAPLTDIETTAEAIAAGDLSRRIAYPPSRTEVGRLAAALDTMLGRIEAAYSAREKGEAAARDSEERMRRFVADASHELRTPLTSIRGFAEFYRQQGDAADRAETSRLMSRIEQEANRLSLLVDDMLLLAHLDQDRPLDLQLIDLGSLAVDAVHDARVLQPERPLTVSTPPEPVIVYADDARLRQIIGNLLANALQHTPPAAPVTVRVHASGTDATLAVTDTGPGMTTEQAANVFERFYRADTARTRARGGTGLGLSIASALAQAHGGALAVQTAPGHGATFRLLLPLATVDAAGQIDPPPIPAN
jgi:two-component system OmpR family sensor kinase